MKLNPTLKWIFLSLTACLLAYLGLMVQYVNKTILLPNNRQIIYTLPPKATILQVGLQLQKLGVIQHPHMWAFYAWLKGDSKLIKAGDYQMLIWDTPHKILVRMVEGRFYLYRLLIVEGWTFSQMLKAIETDPMIKQTFICSTPLCVMVKLNIGYLQPEGEFFPDTYMFTRGTPDSMILRKAFNLMQERLGRAWLHRLPGLPYKRPYEALIVASMIEKETQAEVDRPLIAGVILRRLKINMLLQVDPTVSYGLNQMGKSGKLDGGALRVKSPYNTYVNHGLPPTPICLPGLLSIQAALHPIDTGALFYVACGGGRHCFSATYKEHEAKVRKYLHK